MKVAMMGVFTAQKWANITKQSILFIELFTSTTQNSNSPFIGYKLIHILAPASLISHLRHLSILPC